MPQEVVRGQRGWLPYLALAFAVAALGLSAIFVKWANVPGAVNGFYRVALATAVMTLPAAPRARREWPLPRRGVWLAALAGLFFAGDLSSWNTSLLITNAANATLLANTAPLWVGLAARQLFKEKLRPVFWAGLLLAMVGAVVILGSDFLIHPRLGWGDLLALLAGFFYAGFMLATQRARRGLSAMTSWWISAVASAAALLVVGVLLGQPLTGYPLASYLNLLALALITQAGGYLAINYALGHLPAALVAPTLLGQPVVTALLAIPLLGEALRPAQMVGGLIVLAGIWMVHRQAG
ncbi:MAG: DMT family transporter [Anaerolineales bacterium]|nr:DMT family transporter [Anaerolineales bacterium]